MRLNLFIYLLSLSVLCGPISPVYANESKEDRYLIQMLNQLDTLKPLILSAKSEQDTHARVKFHYTTYRDADGKSHPGLLDDINAIQQGIQAKLSKPSSVPRSFEPIHGDYIGMHGMKNNAQ